MAVKDQDRSAADRAQALAAGAANGSTVAVDGDTGSRSAVTPNRSEQHSIAAEIWRIGSIVTDRPTNP
jgi:hypothetical protein